ncbi:MAG: S8 family peptidase [Chloroflexota bacterium]
MEQNNLPHIVLTDPPETQAFTGPSGRNSGSGIPEQNRNEHSRFLQRRFDTAWDEAEKEQQVVSHSTRTGVYLEFKGHPGVELVTKSLEDMRSKKVRLLNVRKESVAVDEDGIKDEEDQFVTYATVFVAHDKMDHFSQKIEQYAEEDSPSGKPRNAPLINSIADLRKASNLESFWRDAASLVPDNIPEWCEVWLSSDTDEVIRSFEKLLEEQNIATKPGFIRFPERSVKLVHVNREQLEQLSILSDDIAEYRRAKETARYLISLEAREQIDWINSLLKRVNRVESSTVSICLLDTGINNGHPLLSPLIADEDCLCVKEDWGTNDHNSHGTLMAGVAGYGDLLDCILNDNEIDIYHSIESVKILPPPPKENEPELWGDITSQAISRAEINAPYRKRVVCMAVSSVDARDQGRPSSWSAAIDQLSAGVGEDTKRLIVVCAGNLSDPAKYNDYPNAQIEDSIHDPAQSWNALTVGAYTELNQINEGSLAGFEPVAPRGGISPFTTTSHSWDDEWPIKPDVLFEGGNVAKDSSDFPTTCDDLSVLSTFHRPLESHFYPFNMTSAATAQASWFAAQIQAKYPQYWPETIRGLMVHSARWPNVLKSQFCTGNSKGDYKNLLRICGYGVPNLDSAMSSASNALTLIAEAELQPFEKKADGSGYRIKEMHFYELPWPRDALLSLPPLAEVTMRVTLSYFIEPGPGEIGWKDRYRYPSHGLRFKLNSPGESQRDFKTRINIAARDEDNDHPGTQSPSDHWLIGYNARHKGSVHSDIWQGSAAALASSNLLAVFPTVGWWKERTHLNRYSSKARYSLIVSITTPEEAVDLYTPVATQIGLTVPVTIQV